MKRQRFLLLAGVTLAVVVLVLSLAWRQGGQFRDSDGAPVLAGLEAKINDVDQIVISTHDGAAVTLERGESRWTIAELDGYPVDWPVLRKVLTELAQMKIAETKTANPAYFSRLGLEDLSEPDAPGLRIDIRAGEESWSVIVGKEADLQDGHYVRVSDAEQALLADRNLEMSHEPVDWAPDTILDVGPGLIAEVSIQHPDGEQVRISKVSADDSNFTLRTLPAGREPLSEFKVNSLVNAYSALRMEDVRKDPGKQDGAPVQVKVVAFSGERYAIEAFTWDDERWIRVKHQAASETDDPGSADAGTPDGGPELEGWVFRVPDTRLDMMTSRLESLLKPLESAAEDSSP